MKPFRDLAKMEPQMNADERRRGLDRITEKVIGCAYEVGKVLGCGFLEKVYENALIHEMRHNGMDVAQQYPIRVFYDDVVVGEYVADILVEGAVLVEVKSVKELEDVHLAQCLNYLRATALSVCLLMNFGKPRVEVRRVVKDF